MSAPAPGDSPASTAKVCVHCGRDCAALPRKRDTQGRYHCQACLDRLTAAKKAAAAPDAAADAPSEPAPPPEPDVIPLEAEPASELPPGIRGDRLRARPCPICGEMLKTKAALCVNCGYNAATGQKTPTQHRDKFKSRAFPTCASCGYTFRGLETPQCPECGTFRPADYDKRARDLEDAKAIARREYIKPLLMFVAGAGIVCIILALSDPNPMAAVLSYLIGYAIQVPIGVAVFWLCCYAWIGFDAPMHLTALRLLGIIAVVDVAGVLGSFIPFPFVGLFLAGVLYLHLLSELLEMELVDAMFVGIITYVAMVFGKILIFLYVL